MIFIRLMIGLLFSVALLFNHTRAEEFGKWSIPATLEDVLYFEKEDINIIYFECVTSTDCVAFLKNKSHHPIIIGSVNDLNNWKVINDFRAIPEVRFQLPARFDYRYLGKDTIVILEPNHKLLITYNKGESWKTLILDSMKTTVTGNYGNGIIFAHNAMNWGFFYYSSQAGRYEQINITTDGGNTFSTIDISALKSDYINSAQFINDTTLFLIKDKYLYKSYDLGNSWDEIPSFVSIEEDSDSIGFAFDVFNFFVLNDNVFFIQGRVIKYNPENNHFIEANNFLYRTLNGGYEWETAETIGGPAARRGLHFYDQDNGAMIGHDIRHTSNGGKSWHIDTNFREIRHLSENDYDNVSNISALYKDGSFKGYLAASASKFPYRFYKFSANNSKPGSIQSRAMQNSIDVKVLDSYLVFDGIKFFDLDYEIYTINGNLIDKNTITHQELFIGDLDIGDYFIIITENGSFVSSVSFSKKERSK